MEIKDYSTGKKLFWAVIHQMFLVLMVVGIFYLGSMTQPVMTRNDREIFELQNQINGLKQAEGKSSSLEEDTEWPADMVMNSPEKIEENASYLIIFASTVAILGLVGSLLILAYLTLMSGRKSNVDTELHMEKIDSMPSDVMVVLMIVLFVFLVQYIYYLSELKFDTAGLLVTVGTITYLMDVPFLFFYLSFVRRIKAESLVKNSILYKLDRELKHISEERQWLVRHMSRHILGLVAGIVSMTLLFTYKLYAMIAVLIAIILWDIYSQMKHSTDQHKLQEAIEAIAQGELTTSLNVSEFHNQEQELAVALNSIQVGLQTAVEERIKNERMKADLITNVSHDIKTPLTSIINYVELLKRENIQDENALKYIRVIDEKAQRLKQLTEDLVEASRISSGNVKMVLTRIDLVELLYQTGGEFNERFENRNLTIVSKFPQTSVYIMADGRQLYRSIENIYINASKYAMENTRVYVDLTIEESDAVFTMKNISAKPVVNDTNGPGDLTARFVRGEASRTTEGSGLGLSIAKNLINMMGGHFDVQVDGDLFIVTMRFSLDL